jgi:hypothetical protein
VKSRCPRLPLFRISNFQVKYIYKYLKKKEIHYVKFHKTELVLFNLKTRIVTLWFWIIQIWDFKGELGYTEVQGRKKEGARTGSALFFSALRLLSPQKQLSEEVSRVASPTTITHWPETPFKDIHVLGVLAPIKLKKKKITLT